MKSAVLFVSPSVEDARTLAPMLEPLGIPFSHATDLTQAKKLLASTLFGAVVTEASLPDGTWKDVVGVVGRIRRRVAWW
jgi:CheY-like chemotaxis protein